MASLTELAAGHGFTAGDFYTSGQFALCPAYQKIYFADGRPYSVTPADNGYHKLDFINTRIVGTVTGTFTQGEVVTQADSDAQGIFDENYGTGATAWSLIYRTTSAEFEAAKEITGADSGAKVTPAAAANIVAPPHWLPWVLTDGSFPDGGSDIMALCFGRIFMNSLANPHHFYGTRPGDPLDLLMSQDDVGTAVSSQTSDAGVVGDQLVALVAYKDNYLIFGCSKEMWVLRSDPAKGGILTNLTKETGIFSSTSWCWDDKNNFYFVGMDGIYVVSAEAIINSSPPSNLTKDRVPQLVSGMALNRRTDRIAMGYDKQRYGLNVTVSQKDNEWSNSFFVNLKEVTVGGVAMTGGIFPEVYKDGCQPASMMYFNSRTDEDRGLLFGCYDGYIRKFDDTEKSDDGDTAIDSFVTLGPYSNPKNNRDSVRLSEVTVTPSVDTDGITVNIYTGKSAEQAVNNTIEETSLMVSKTLKGDTLLPSVKHKVSAQAITIRLGNDTLDESWSVEKINANIRFGKIPRKKGKK